DDALARVEPEHPRRRRGDHLHPALNRDLSPHDTLKDEVDAVLDARKPVRDLGEVATPELLLLLEAERAVIGRDNRQVVGPKPAPQLVQVPCGTQWRRADEFGPFKA